MLPEYKKVLDTFGLKHTGDGCYSWNGHWLVSYYGDENFCMWAVMKDIRKEWMKNGSGLSITGLKTDDRKFFWVIPVGNDVADDVSHLEKVYEYIKERS